MLKIGFDVKWVQLVMTCVTSVQYSVLVNGTPGKSFIPSRGIRQGDLISLYLFLLCAEVLSSLLSQAGKKIKNKNKKINYFRCAHFPKRSNN